MPGCLDLLTAGRISEYTAHLVVTETSHLDSFIRRRVDANLVRARVAEMSPREAQARARQLVYEADPQGSLTRGRTARRQRRVTLRPAPDTMSHLHAFLPVEKGVACYAALKHQVDAVVATGDERTRDQIMADTVVERLTGQAAAADGDIEVQLLMPIESLLDRHATASALIPGQGPVPAWAARDMMNSSGGRKWWRRLFTAPTPDGSRAVVDIDRGRRRFTGWLADLIKGPRPVLPRSLLHRLDPPPRPHRTLRRRRGDHSGQRPRGMRTGQLPPRDVRMVGHHPPLGHRRAGAHHRTHHAHRTLLPQPSPGPTPIA